MWEIINLMSIFLDTKPELGSVVKSAFFFWKKSFLYQVVFSMFFLSLLMIGMMYFMDYYGFSEDLFRISQTQSDPAKRYEEMQKYIAGNANAGYFSWAVIGLLCMVFPLNLGLFAVYRKIELRERITISDLFTGYRGKNFFVFVSYYLFWILIFNLSLSVIPILSFAWVLMTLFVAPLMFFKNVRIFEGISITITVFRKYFLEIVVAFFIGLMVKYIGMLTFVGIPLFFGFSNAMIYAMYRSIFTMEK